MLSPAEVGALAASEYPTWSISVDAYGAVCFLCRRVQRASAAGTGGRCCLLFGTQDRSREEWRWPSLKRRHRRCPEACQPNASVRRLEGYYPRKAPRCSRLGNMPGHVAAEVNGVVKPRGSCRHSALGATSLLPQRLVCLQLVFTSTADYQPQLTRDSSRLRYSLKTAHNGLR